MSRIHILALIVTAFLMVSNTFASTPSSTNDTIPLSNSFTFIDSLEALSMEKNISVSIEDSQINEASIDSNAVHRDANDSTINLFSDKSGVVSFTDSVVFKNILYDSVVTKMLLGVLDINIPHTLDIDKGDINKVINYKIITDQKELDLYLLNGILLRNDLFYVDSISRKNIESLIAWSSNSRIDDAVEGIRTITTRSVDTTVATSEADMILNGLITKEDLNPGDSLIAFSLDLFNSEDIETRNLKYPSIDITKDSVIYIGSKALENIYFNKNITESLNNIIEDFDNDSTCISIYNNNINKQSYSLHRNNPSSTRYWIKNEVGDSLCLWIGSPDKYSLNISIEDGVDISHIAKKQQEIVQRSVDIKGINSTLKDVDVIKFKTSPWVAGMSSSLQFNQYWYENWNGKNSVTLLLIGDFWAKYTMGKMSWNNTLNTKFGFQSVEDQDMVKNVDKIDLNSRFEYKAVGQDKWSYSASANMKSQWSSTYKRSNDTKTLISKPFSPAYFSAGIGLTWKPKKTITVTMNPISLSKLTYVSDPELKERYRVDLDKKMKAEMGASMRVVSTHKIFDDVNWGTKLELSNNYMEDPFNIDIYWENKFTISLNNWISANVNLFFKYDDNMLFGVEDKDGNPVLGSDGNQRKVPKLQFQEFLGIGFKFKFNM